MQLLEITGDVFDVAGHGATALAHGVNTHGVMGAGVAVGFKTRWPAMYRRYRDLCRNGTLQPGMVWPWRSDDGITVYNLATQDRPGRHARLDWVADAVTKMMHHADTHGIDTVAMPRIGCGIGGLQWDDVRAALEALDAPGTLLVVTPAT